MGTMLYCLVLNDVVTTILLTNKYSLCSVCGVVRVGGDKGQNNDYRQKSLGVGVGGCLCGGRGEGGRGQRTKQ